MIEREPSGLVIYVWCGRRAHEKQKQTFHTQKMRVRAGKEVSSSPGTTERPGHTLGGSSQPGREH